MTCHACGSVDAADRGCWGELCDPCFASCVAWLERLLGRKHRWSTKT